MAEQIVSVLQSLKQEASAKFIKILAVKIGKAEEKALAGKMKKAEGKSSVAKLLQQRKSA